MGEEPQIEELRTKVCPHCGLRQTLTEFTRDKSRPDGRETYCRTCKRAYSAARFATHHDEILERGREYNQRPEVKQHKQEYERKPEIRKRRREQDRKPERQARKRELDQRTEAKKKQRDYDQIHKQKPEVKEAHRLQMKQYTIDHPEWAILHRAKNRARTKKVPFSLQLENIAIPELCPVLGIRLKVGEKEKTDQSPSIDEIIPGLGYVPGNIAVISDRANSLKNNGTANEHRLIAEWMKKYLEGALETTPTRPALTSKEKRVVLSARQRAKKKGLDFDLHPEDVKFPACCPVFGVALSGGTQQSHENSPSLDRVDSSKGYTTDNIAIICHRANFVKSNGTAEEHLKIAEWIDKMTAKKPKTVLQ